MLALTPKVIYHENVERFGLSELTAIFGHLYLICRVVLAPDKEGWAIRRGRQFVIMMLRTWALPQLGSDADVCWIADLHKFTFSRNCSYHHRSYFVSNEEEHTAVVDPPPGLKQVVGVHPRGGQYPSDQTKLEGGRYVDV